MMKKLSMILVVAMLVTMVIPFQGFAAAINLEDVAVYADDDVSINGTSVINGDLLITDGTVSGRNYRSVTGTVYKTDDVKVKVPALETADFDGEIDLETPDYDVPDKDFFSNNYYNNGRKNLIIDNSGNTDEIREDGFYLKENAFINKLEVKKSSTLNIHAFPDEVRIIRVRELIVGGSIQVVGGGKVVLIADEFKGANDGRINVDGSPDDFTLVLDEDDDDFKFSIGKIVANVIALSDISVGNIDMTGNLYAAEDFEFTAQGIIRGVVYAPDSSTKMAGGATIEGRLVTESLEMAGNAAINYVPTTKEEDPEVTPEPTAVPEPTEEPVVTATPEPTAEPTPIPEKPVSGTIQVVEFDVASGSYTHGVMKTKAHQPTGYDYIYDVLDENTFTADGKPVPQEIKDKIQLLYETTNFVFSFRKNDVSLQPFGRVDSEAYQYALTISPFVVPMLEEGGIDTESCMWLAWGNRSGEVVTIWFAVE